MVGAWVDHFRVSEAVCILFVRRAYGSSSQEAGWLGMNLFDLAGGTAGLLCSQVRPSITTVLI